MPVLTQRQVDIVESLYGLNITLARGDDDQRRQLTKKIAEQFRFEFGPRWGTKSTTPSHPQSKDAIAYDNQDGTIDVWDWQNGSTREPQVDVGDEPDYTNLTQHFIAVEPVNHLGSVPGNGDDNDDNKEVIALLKELIEKTKEVQVEHARLLEGQRAILEAVQVLLDKPAPDFPPIEFPNYEIKGNAAFNRLFGSVTATKK